MNHVCLLWPLLRLLSLPWFLLLLMISLLSGLSGIGLLGASAWLVSHAALQPPLYTLSLAVTFVRACGITRASARYAERILAHRLAFRAMESLHLFLYRKAAREIPMREGAACQSRFVEELMQGTVVLRDFYLRALLPSLGTFFLTLCFVFWVFDDVPELSYLVLALWCVQIVWPHMVANPSSESESEAGESYRRALEDFSAGRDELLSAGRVSAAKERLDAFAFRYASSRRKSGAWTDGIGVILEFCRQGVFFAALFVLGGRVAAGTLAGTELSVLLFMTLALLTEYKPLAAAAEELRATLRHLPAIFSAHEAEKKEEFAEDMEGAPPVFSFDAPALAVKDLRFSYRSGVPVFSPLSFTVGRGEAVAVIGESGAGKTTLASLLLGFWKPDAGSIARFGKTELTEDEMRRLFSAALQGCYIFSDSLRDNFTRLHPGISDRAIWDALEDAQLADFVRTLPKTLDASPGADASRLSGGQRGRLLTALALAGEAPMLLLDEPMNGLDAGTARALLAALLRRTGEQGQTLLLITHDAETMESLPRRLVLRPASAREALPM